MSDQRVARSCELGDDSTLAFGVRTAGRLCLAVDELGLARSRADGLASLDTSCEYEVRT